MREIVSIITPVYNAENYIGETIESVLNQDYGDFELILVNDCSTDNSVKVIKSFSDERIRLVEMDVNDGAYAARNKGLSIAGGRYIAFIDADDLWDKNKLSKQLGFLKDNDAGFTFTGYEFADSKGKGTGAVVKVPYKVSFKKALKNTNIFTSTVLIDREKIPDELIKMPEIKSEDTATWWNILMAGFDAYGLNENLVRYRRPEHSLSSNKIEAIRRIWGLYRKIAKLNVIESAFYFCFWAITAVLRRI